MRTQEDLVQYETGDTVRFVVRQWDGAAAYETEVSAEVLRVEPYWRGSQLQCRLTTPVNGDLDGLPARWRAGEQVWVYADMHGRIQTPVKGGQT